MASTDVIAGKASPGLVEDLNAFGRLIRSLFKSFDNVRLSTVSVVITVLTGVLFVTGAVSTVVTLHNVTTIAANWRDFDTGLGRRLDLMTEVRGRLGYGGLIQHWTAWKAGDDAAGRLLSRDIESLRALRPAWAASHPNAEQSQAFSTVMDTVEAYGRALAAGQRGAMIDDGNALTALGSITSSLQEQRKTGADSVEDAMWRLEATVAGVMTLSAIFLTMLALFYLWFTRYRVNAPIQAFSSAMLRLSQGDKTVRVPFTEKSDEMGEMARTVRVFRENMIRADQLEEEKRAADQVLIAKAELRANLTEAFGISANRLLSIVEASVNNVRKAAGNVQELALRTGHQGDSVASAAAEAAANVQQVAAAAEEMGASIGEIGSSVSRSTDITRSAVSEFSALEGSMAELAGATSKIGEIVALIDEIASQTNLLALNASIEAQRAGEAGKGFAVVANEVKVLAGQTSRATQDIARQIGQVQSRAAATMKDLQGVATTVGKADEVVASIAAAIEQQSATTREIARNVAEAATSNSNITDSMKLLATDVSEVSVNATSMGETIDQLSHEAKSMEEVVRRFLDDVHKT